MRAPALASLFARQFALALSLLALLAQAAIPAGYMAAPSDGRFPLSIVLCGGNGATVSASDLGLTGHGDQSPDAPDGGGAPCVFAGFGAGIVAPDLPSLLSAPVSYAVAQFAPASRRAALSVGANAPPPARAPPAFI